MSLDKLEYAIEHIRDILSGISAHLNDINNELTELKDNIPMISYDEIVGMASSLESIDKALWAISEK